MNNEVTLYSDHFPACKTSFCVAEQLSEDGRFVVCVDTGAAYLQTYATRDELRALGEMLIQHADAGEVLEVGAPA